MGVPSTDAASIELTAGTGRRKSNGTGYAIGTPTRTCSRLAGCRSGSGSTKILVKPPIESQALPRL